MSSPNGKCNVPCHFAVYVLLFILGVTTTLSAIGNIPAAKAWVCEKEMSVLEKKIEHFRDSPILMPVPNSDGMYLVIFRKEILLEKVQVNSPRLRLTQVKKGFKSFDSYQQYDDCFAFLLTREDAEDPFIIEYLDNNIWLPATIL